MITYQAISTILISVGITIVVVKTMSAKTLSIVLSSAMAVLGMLALNCVVAGIAEQAMLETAFVFITIACVGWGLTFKHSSEENKRRENYEKN